MIDPCDDGTLVLCREIVPLWILEVALAAFLLLLLIVVEVVVGHHFFRPSLCFHQNRWDSKTRPEGKQNQSSFYIRLHHKMTIMSHTIIGEMRNPPIIFGKSNKSNRITGKGLEKAEEQNLGSLPTIPAMPLAPATLIQQHIVLQEIFLQVSYDGRERPQEVNAGPHRMYRLLRWFICTSKNRNNTA